MSDTCPGCGASTAKGARFCRSCGSPLTQPDRGLPPGKKPLPSIGSPTGGPPTALVPPPTESDVGLRPRRSTRAAWWLIGTLAALVVILSGVVTLLALTRDPGQPSASSMRRSADSTPGASDPTTTPTTSITEPGPTTTIPPTTAPPSPPPPTTTVPVGVRGTAVRTCGRDGRGYCNVAVRTRPTPDAPEIRQVDEGQPIWVVCQVPGAPAYSSVLDESIPIWVRTHDGLYAANIFVEAPGFELRSINVPCTD